MSTQHQQVGCELCLDEEIESRTYQGHALCAACVQGCVAQFEQAIRNQTQYPVRWGTEVLKAENFVEVLGQDFVRRYRRIELQYNAPVGNRLYCDHKLHPRDALPRGSTVAPGVNQSLKSTAIAGYSDRDKDGLITCGHLVTWRVQRSGTQLTCYHCGGHLCACGQTLDTPNQRHDCIQPIAPGETLEVELVRGRHFQRCPHCETPIELKDGCNAMTCGNCRTEFCMICGERAIHDSGHWTEGAACPRFGQPGDARAIFDAPPRAPPAEFVLPVVPPDVPRELLPVGFELPRDPNELARLAAHIRHELAIDWRRLVRMVPEGTELRNRLNARLRVLAPGVAIEDDEEVFNGYVADILRRTVRISDIRRLRDIITEVVQFVEAPENAARRDALWHLRGLPRSLVRLIRLYRAGGLAFNGINAENEDTRLFLRQNFLVLRDLRLVDFVRQDAGLGQLLNLQGLYEDFLNELDAATFGAVAHLVI